jgi:hypothetical protein
MPLIHSYRIKARVADKRSKTPRLSVPSYLWEHLQETYGAACNYTMNAGMIEHTKSRNLLGLPDEMQMSLRQKANSLIVSCHIESKAKRYVLNHS